MIITISGQPGSGKSTLAKLLSKKLGYAHYSMGDFRRDIAREHHLTIQELNAIGEKELWTDAEADKRLQTLAAQEDNFVVDSRTGFHFVPRSVKIFISVSSEIGAQRIYQDLVADPSKRNEGPAQSLETVREHNRMRIASDQLRYKKYYGIDYLDESNYDFVLDTSDLGIPDALERLYAFVRTKLGVPHTS